MLELLKHPPCFFFDRGIYFYREGFYPYWLQIECRAFSIGELLFCIVWSRYDTRSRQDLVDLTIQYEITMRSEANTKIRLLIVSCVSISVLKGSCAVLV